MKISQNKLTIIASLFSIALLGACSQENTPAPAAKPKTEQTTADNTNTKEVVPSERYIVGTDIGYPPFDFRDDKGQIVGFDMDILKAIAKDQGFAVEFAYTTQRSTLFPDLGANKYQILAACLGVNEERLKLAEMSDYYAYAPNAILSKDSKKAVKLEKLNGVVAVQDDSHSHHTLEKLAIKNVKAEKSTFDAFKLFAKGDVDYVVGDAGLLNYYVKTYADQLPEVSVAVYDPTEDARIAFAVQKGNTELIGKINKGLANIRANGEYDRIYKEWFGDNDGLKVESFQGKK